MRKSRLLLTAVVFAGVVGSFGVSHADACGSSPKDPFGSCETGKDLGYHVQCAAQNAIPSVGSVTPITASPPGVPTASVIPRPVFGGVGYSQGVEVCVDGASLPVGGRAGVAFQYEIVNDPDPNATSQDLNMHITVFEDGNETKDPGLTGGWNRVDAGTSAPLTNPGAATGSSGACAKRGETGTWDHGQPNTVDEGVSGAGATPNC